MAQTDQGIGRNTRHKFTCKSTCVSERPDLRVGESNKPADECVYHNFVINDVMLALIYKQFDKVGEIALQNKAWL